MDPDQDTTPFPFGADLLSDIPHGPHEFDPDAIDAAVQQMGAWVAADYAEKEAKLVAALFGSFESEATVSTMVDGTLTEQMLVECMEKLDACEKRRKCFDIRASDAMVEQYRYPRSKKRRIRNKWASRPENWRPLRNALVTPDGLFVHPTVLSAFREAWFQPNNIWSALS